jgi:hypothetical protein
MALLQSRRIISSLVSKEEAGITPEVVLQNTTQAPQRGSAERRPVYTTFSPTTFKRVEASDPQFVVTFTEDKQGFYINGQKFEMNSGPMLTVDVGSL